MLYSENKREKKTAFVSPELLERDQGANNMKRIDHNNHDSAERFDLNIFQEIY